MLFHSAFEYMLMTGKKLDKSRGVEDVKNFIMISSNKKISVSGNGSENFR